MRQTTPLVRSVVRVLVQPDDLDDVVQDVFTRLYQNSQQYRPLPSGSFTAWLTVVARNVAIDHIRRRGSSSRGTPSPGGEDVGMHFLEYVRDPDADTEENALELLGEGDMLASLREGLDALSPRQREMLMLHYVSGYSYKEIGVLKRISEGTVRTLLGRARSTLRRYIEK